MTTEQRTPERERALETANALLEGKTLWADEAAFMLAIRSVSRNLIASESEHAAQRTVMVILKGDLMAADIEIANYKADDAAQRQEIQRLRKVIEDADHARDCTFREWECSQLNCGETHSTPCSCFKMSVSEDFLPSEAALSDQPAATPTTEEMLHGAADLEAIGTYGIR